MPISSNNEKYRLVLLTNIPETGKPVDKEFKQAVLDKITFKCAAEWNAGDANPALIPMWGESSETFTIKKDNNYVKILLHRALARVDIGCGFKFLTPNPSNPSEPIDETDKEAVWGLDIFKIKSVRVYRTKNLAYVASASQYMSNNEIIQPYIPSEAIYNSSKTSLGHQNIDDADNDPLTFILPEAADSYIRHIYIPESVIYPTATPDMDETPCLVVGGYYNGNTQKEQFYRADFADYNKGKVAQYKPILRNHRYVFNIKSVTSPGFEHPKHALFSVKANMSLDVVDWTEVNLEQHLNGNYSFKIFNKKDIVLPSSQATATTELPYFFTLLYGTKNIVLDAVHNPFNIYWDSSQTGNSSYFNLGVDYSQHQIYISPKGDNTTGANIVDYLNLKVEKFVVRIKVTQMGFLTMHSSFFDVSGSSFNLLLHF